MRGDRPRIALTAGDINGIGPEVLFGALRDPHTISRFDPLIVGNARLLAEHALALGIECRAADGALELDGRSIPLHPVASDASLLLGSVDARAGRLAGDAIVAATRLALSGDVDAIVTMPISKESLHAGGYDHPGHTELIASISGGEPLMILAGRGMRVGLLTVHVPIAAVSALITRELVTRRLVALDRSMRRDFGITSPRVAMLGLNPHAGENGHIGREEIAAIEPALAALRNGGMQIDGPLAADGYFARWEEGMHDGILACYHDQGLIPLKMHARDEGVNITAGLPVVRTSPDHGTAYGIAGRGIARHRSAVAAIEAAVAIVAARRRANVQEEKA